MRKATVPALVLSIALLGAGRMAENPARMQWVRMHHAVVPSGSGTMSFGGKPVAIQSAYGYRAGTEGNSDKVAAFHVIVTFEADSVSRLSSWDGGERFDHVSGDEWWAWSGSSAVGRSLVSRYDPVRRRVEIGGRRYSLAAGNLFLARYDREGRLVVRQLARTVRSVDQMRVARIFQALLPSDPIVADMLHYASPPCPPSSPSASRAGAA